MFHSYHTLCHHPDQSAAFLVHICCFSLISSCVGHRFWLFQVVVHTRSIMVTSTWWAPSGGRMYSLQLFHNNVLMEEDVGSPSKGWPVFLWRKNTPGFWKRDQRDTEVIPLKECHRSYPDELVNVNRLLRSTWRLVVYDEDQREMSRRPSWLDRRRLSNQDFWEHHLSGHPAHLVDSAMGLKKTGISCWEWRWQLLSSSPREGKCEQSERWICGGRENVSGYVNLVLKENAWEINATRDWGGFLPSSSGPSHEALKARLLFYIMSQSRINICKPILENLRINGPEMEHFCCLTAGVLIIPGSTIVSFHFIFLCAHMWHLTSS